MNYGQMTNLMENIWKQVQQTREDGQKEYAHEQDNVLANFNRVGNLLNVKPGNVLLVYLMKHIDGITAYLAGHKSQREDVRGRIKDAIVYLCLLWAMVEEENEKV